MSSDVAIRVEGLAKSYTIKHNQTDHVTLAEVALDKAKHPFRRSEREQFWALQDINFEVKQGEVIGLIGRNGAGKSTLLKVLSRITEPTKGRIDLWGRVGSLLEVGTGFHPELTGRENIYLNGSILGMTRKEIDKQFDAIVDFSGVDKFLDTPVKRYSSGMYVRLAFAVAAHLQTEILLVDEVLAVGDVAFQRKSIGKMKEVARGGRTVVFVSHNLATIQELTESAVVLENGTCTYAGSAEMAIQHYLDTATDTKDHDLSERPRGDKNLSREIELVAATTDSETPALRAGVEPKFLIGVRMNETVPNFRISFSIFAVDGRAIASGFSNDVCPSPHANAVDLRLSIPLANLAPGTYQLGLAACEGNEYTSHRDFDYVPDALTFEIGAPVNSQGQIGQWLPAWGSLRVESPTLELA